MPPRLRRHTRTELLAHNVRMKVRWDKERDIESFAVVLQYQTTAGWQNVVLYDCSHPERNDRHRYSRDGVKGEPEPFHHGTAAQAFRAAVDLIRDSYERMIEQWQR
jgi:creatinine amidohydrolase/Fe(II)-dependent formamide hydrolase-like protein